jgi:hypothetical protein
LIYFIYEKRGKKMPYVKDTRGKNRYITPNAFNKWINKKDKTGRYINRPKIVEGEFIIDGQGYSIATSQLNEFLKNLPEKKQGFSYDKSIYKQVGNQLLLKNPQQVQRQKTYIVTSQTAPIVNRIELRKFKERLAQAREKRQERIFRPLRPVKTIRNIGQKINLLNRAETLQRNLETKEARAYAIKNEPLKSFGRQSAILGLSFGTEVLRGVKGFIALPKNIIKTIPKLPKGAINLVKNRKNIIPMAKLRFKTFRETQGYLLRTSPSTFFGKVGANIFLFKATGEGLKLAGKLTKPATSKIAQYLPKFTKKSKVIFQGIQIQKGNKIYSVIKFKAGKKIYGYAVGVGKIGKSGQLVFSRTIGKAFKSKSFSYLRKQPLNLKKQISFISEDIGRTAIRKGVQNIYIKKGVTIQKAIKNIIQFNVGRTAQVRGKRFFNKALIFPTGQIKRIKVQNIELRRFFAKSKIFTKKDWSLIIGRARTNRKEIISYLGRIKTLKRGGGVSIISGTKALKTIGKQNLVNIASALSVGQVGARKILNKLSPMARKVIINNIKAGLVLIPKVNFKNIGGSLSLIPSVSAKSTTQQGTKYVNNFKHIVTLVTKNQTFLKIKSVSKQQKKLIEVLRTQTAQREIQRLTPRQKENLKQYLRQYLRFYPKMKTPLIRVIPFSFVVKSKTKVRRTLNYKNLKTGWAVYGLSKGAYRRLNKKPLSKQDALSRGAYAIDRTTSRTFKIVPIPNVKGFGRLIKREKGYFTLTKPKFREYRIVKGQKRILIYTLIEKRKYLIDTQGEKKGLSLYRYLSKLKKQGKY